MTIHAVYTLDTLCRLWGVKKRTLYFWLRLERLAGRAPSRFEKVTKIAGRKKAMLLREDYARKIQDRYVFRAFRRQKGSPKVMASTERH